VSSELQDTLKDEMGLDELAEIGKIARGEFPATLDAPPSSRTTSNSDTSTVGTSEIAQPSGAGETEEDLRRMREESARLAWGPQTDGGTGESVDFEDDTAVSSEENAAEDVSSSSSSSSSIPTAEASDTDTSDLPE